MTREQIDQQLKDAMRARDSGKVTVLRSLNAAIRAWEIDNRQDMEHTMLLALIEKQLKQRRESLQAYIAAGRPELAAQEEQEAAILSALLPAQLTDKELTAIIREAITLTGATSVRDMGKVMAPVREKTAGRAEGARISALIRQLLS